MTLSAIDSKIKQAENSAGRAIGSTQLIAVSKVQPNERVLKCPRARASSFWRK